jgi:hypothetical protein
MFHKLTSFFRRDDLTEKNVIKQIDNCLNMILEGDYFAEKHVGIAIFQKREDLKGAFIKYIKEELMRIVTSVSPYREFREKIIKTIKVDVINDVLLGEEFEHSRDKICEAINCGITSSKENEFLDQAMFLVGDAEMFSDQPWGYTKLVHEKAWAELEAMVLRHLQIMVFEHVKENSNWWDSYRQAYEIYVIDFYRVMIGKADITKGFPHPMIAAMSNKELMHMEEIILNGTDK